MSTSRVLDSTASLGSLRRDLAAKTGRGMNAVVAAVLLWSVFAILGVFVTDGKALALAYVFGSGMLFPVSLAVAKVMGLDPYAKGNDLGVLAGLLGGVQILFIPLMLGATFLSPGAVPWFLAVLVGAHLLPFTWVYKSRAYLFASVSIPVAAALVAWLLPGLVPVAAPGAVIALLLVTAYLLARENASTPVP